MIWRGLGCRWWRWWEGIRLGMFLKTENTELTEGMDNVREERNKSKVMPGYFGLTTWGDISTTY